MLMDYAKLYDAKSLKKLFLVHGDEKSLEAFQLALKKDGFNAEVTEKDFTYRIN